MKKQFGNILICLVVLGMAFALTGCPVSADRTFNDVNRIPGFTGGGLSPAANLIGTWVNTYDPDEILVIGNGTITFHGDEGTMDGSWVSTGSNSITVSIDFFGEFMEIPVNFALSNNNNTLNITMTMFGFTETETYHRQGTNTPTPTPPPGGNNTQIVGTWVNTYDSTEIVTFNSDGTLSWQFWGMTIPGTWSWSSTNNSFLITTSWGTDTATISNNTLYITDEDGDTETYTRH